MTARASTAAAAAGPDDDPPRDFVVDLEGYEGPLDLLLTLAREQKVDLTQISIVRLAEQYLEFVAAVRHADLELAAEYLVMAAWLAYLKSRLLLPQAGPAEEPSPEDLAAGLAFQLRHLEAMREAGAKLLRRPRLGVDVFGRGRSEPIEVNTERVLQASLYDLLSAYARCQARNREPPVLRVGPSAFDSVEKALSRLRRGLGRSPGWESLSRFLPPEILGRVDRGGLAARSGIASTFAAALELVREGEIALRQTSPFGPIFLRPVNRQAQQP
ncbi:MAG TPA: ScpA family protein [Rhodospirillales bacterium]|nr:ScpA family protein [Rhodospirillales bacterium]